ncbi:MAG: bifunctional folylpolyglutamate synthase/dihydrofolate synthase [Deltaproteobacteria bacterium]|nr:MAG: bifunctional folylpolyglutamate synthase/dihydrofolate synthase [Deltaproteobacteria bacterium]
MDYQQAVNYLDSLQVHKIKLGLEAINSLLARLGNPHLALKFIHVAGTNGKGSVCAAMAAILQEAGYQPGLYTSPHLYEVRERFRVGRKYISKDDFAEVISRIAFELGDEKITYFECLTAAAFLWFAEIKPDLVILETGLGGRLDATNVVMPLISIITNISMDHEAYLGYTLKDVAAEKAGIIKPQVLVITGCRGESLTVIKKAAREKKAEVLVIDQDFSAAGQGRGFAYLPKNSAKALPLNMVCGLEGEHQPENISLAVTAAFLLEKQGYKIKKEHILSGIKNLHWPGRQEHIKVQSGGRQVAYFLDGGHNPAGIASLQKSLQNRYNDKKLYLIWAAMVDKDGQQTLPKLAPLMEKIYLPRMETERSAEPEKIAENLTGRERQKCVITDDVRQAMLTAEQHLPENGLIVAAGSLYLVGMVRFLLLGSLLDS